MALPAKLTPPRLAGALARTRIDEALDRLARTGTVWVHATAGAGKTTLLAQWSAGRDGLRLWYTADATDSDPAALCESLRAALGALGVPPRELPAPYAAGTVTDEALFATGFAGSFYASFRDGPVCLVIDNAHEVDAGSGFWPIVEALVRARRDADTFAIASRGPPPPRLARSRANRELALLAGSDLVFGEDEVDAMLTAAGLTDPALRRRISRRCHGWPAAAILLAELARDCGLPPEDTPDAGDPSAFEYLARQVFNHLPEAARRGLLDCAYAPHLDPVLVAALTDPAAAAAVQALVGQGFLLVPYGEAGAFRPHPMVKQFLQDRLEAEGRASDRRVATASACAREAPAYAVDLLLGAGAVSEAAAYLRDNAREWMADHRWQSLRAALESLPAGVLSADPWLAYWLGRAWLAQSWQEARPRLESAWTLFSKRDGVASTGALLCAAGVVETYRLEFDHFAGLDPWCDALVKGLAGVAGALPPADALPILSAAMTAALWRVPDRPEIAKWGEQVLALLEAPLPAIDRVLAAMPLLEYYIAARRTAEGRALCARIDGLLERSSVPMLHRLMWMRTEGYFLLGVPDPAAAARIYDEVKAAAREHRLARLERDIIVSQINAAIAQGDLDRAEALLAEEASLLDAGSRIDVGYHELNRATLSMRRGRRAEAERHARTALELALAVGVMDLQLVNFHAVLAAAVLAQGRAVEAATEFGRAVAISRGARARWIGISQRMALAGDALGREATEAARTHLRAALHDAAELGHVQVLSYAPDTLARLAAEALAAGIETEFVGRLVRTQSLAPPPSAGEQWPWRFHVRVLGGFGLLRDGEPLAMPRKTPRRLLELLKTIVALGSRQVSVQRLSDALWPGSEGGTAHDLLESGLHRLRRLLGDSDAITVSDGRVSLAADRVWVDAVAFEAAIAPFEAAGITAPETSTFDSVAFERAVAIYRGPFLGDEPGGAWFLAARERLSGKLGRAAQAMIRWSLARGALVEAGALAGRLRDLDPSIGEALDAALAGAESKAGGRTRRS